LLLFELLWYVAGDDVCGLVEANGLCAALCADDKNLVKLCLSIEVIFLFELKLKTFCKHFLEAIVFALYYDGHLWQCTLF